MFVAFILKDGTVYVTTAKKEKRLKKIIDKEIFKDSQRIYIEDDYVIVEKFVSVN